MWTTRREDEAHAMHDEAVARLRERAWPEALRLADALEAMGWSGGFEVRALVHRARGERGEALSVLDRGIAEAPLDGALQLLRANLLDEAGRGDEALLAYEAALRVGHVAPTLVLYNRAVMLLGRGDAGGALADAERIVTEAPESEVAAAALRVAVDALIRLGRAEHAVSIVEHVEAILRDAPAGGDGSDAGPTPELALAGLRAKALLAAGHPREEARALCETIVERGGVSADLLEVLRDLAEPDARPRLRHRAVLDVAVSAEQARAHALPNDVGGYFRPMVIVAADEAEARALATSLEPRALRERAQLQALVLEGPCEERASFVASGAQRHFYGD